MRAVKLVNAKTGAVLAGGNIAVRAVEAADAGDDLGAVGVGGDEQVGPVAGGLGGGRDNLLALLENEVVRVADGSEGIGRAQRAGSQGGNEERLGHFTFFGIEIVFKKKKERRKYYFRRKARKQSE